MSDGDLRRILNEVIEDIDAGRLRVTRRGMDRVRNVVGSAMIAATIGMAGAACDARSVGSAGDAGVRQDATSQLDSGSSLLYEAPLVDGAVAPGDAMALDDSGIAPAYGEPFYDDGGIYDYMAPPVDAGDAPAYMAPSTDAGAQSPDGGGGEAPLYGVP